MIKLSFPLVLLFTITYSKAQVINYRAVEGGGEKVNIDAKATLNDLIKRLEKPWNFVETGKAYWIGYTDDMYSIAAHNDQAIQPLLNLIKSTNNINTKIGAVSTIHLIGINRTIAGRFNEKFIDKQARKALLSLLDDDYLGERVMALLTRDPWQSDVPTLINKAITKKSDYWYIISSLQRYKLKKFPLDGIIPDKIGQTEFKFPSKNISNTADFEIQLKSLVKAIRDLKNPAIIVDKRLFKLNLWGNTKLGMNGQKINNNFESTTINIFLSEVTFSGIMGYGETGSRINYYLKNNKLYICSPVIAKNILVKWWNEQPVSYKQQFISNSNKIN